MGWLILLGVVVVVAAAASSAGQSSSAERLDSPWENIRSFSERSGFPLEPAVERRTLEYNDGRNVEVFLPETVKTKRVALIDLGPVSDGHLRVDARVRISGFLSDYKKVSTFQWYGETWDIFGSDGPDRQRCEEIRLRYIFDVDGGEQTSQHRYDEKGKVCGEVGWQRAPLYYDTPDPSATDGVFEPRIEIDAGRLVLTIGIRPLAANLNGTREVTVWCEGKLQRKIVGRSSAQRPERPD